MDFKLISYLIVFVGIVNLLRMTLFLVGSDLYNLLVTKRKKSIPDAKLPTFSVVIPAHNEKSTVLRAVKSILNNNYPRNRLEIIIVDDGSTDNTTKHIEQFIKTHKTEPVKLIKQTNNGKAFALNNGIINHAKGELIMCLDADSLINKDALRHAAAYFIDPKTVGLSANVKIVDRPGLLNLIQRYEYLLCYQMKRAESLFNCEYIIGGIGSVYRRSIMKKIDYYDTDTVTEDIDITMKVLQLGNKDHKVAYGSDVVAYTESVMSISDLIAQRFRWKWGRMQTFFKNKSMFFSTDSRYTKSLSWFYLPMAIYGDLMYFLEPILLAYIIAISIIYSNPVTIISAWIVISAYLILNILAEDTWSIQQKLKFVLLAPSMYLLFYILSLVEYIALIKSLVKLHRLEDSLSVDKSSWKHVRRHDEETITPALAKDTIRTMSFVTSVIVMILGLITSFVYFYPYQQAVAAKTQISSAKQMPIATPQPSLAPETPEPATVTHVVKNGESLWTIASIYYGDGSLWKNIVVENGSLIIHPGDSVELP